MNNPINALSESIPHEFGWNPWFLLAQIANFLIVVILMYFGVKKALKNSQGITCFFWISLSVLVPIFGGIITLIFCKKK